MSPSEQFEFCPRCAERRPRTAHHIPFHCARCGFLYYFYHYQGVTYPVLDLLFVTRPAAGKVATALEDVDSLCWLNPEGVAPDEIAFPSIREGLRLFLLGRDP